MSDAPDRRPLRIHVLHETHYVYGGTVSQSRQMLHLTPRELPTQRVLAHRVSLAPAPAEAAEALDYFGNPLTHALLTAPHRSLTVAAESTVELLPRTPPEGAVTVATARRWLEQGPGATSQAAWFAFESPNVMPPAALHDWAAATLATDRPLIEAVLELNHRIHAEFEFDPAATTITTPVEQVLSEKRGVCQDFAHLMIGALRSHGIAARYVSGYILTTPPPGMPRLVGSDASHAWVSVCCPDEAGAERWMDLDPTNDCLIDREHVTLGWGRDFSDVTPTRGVIMGGGEQDLAVRVTVTPQDEA